MPPIVLPPAPNPGAPKWARLLLALVQLVTAALLFAPAIKHWLSHRK